MRYNAGGYFRKVSTLKVQVMEMHSYTNELVLSAVVSANN